MITSIGVLIFVPIFAWGWSMIIAGSVIWIFFFFKVAVSIDRVDKCHWQFYFAASQLLLSLFCVHPPTPAHTCTRTDPLNVVSWYHWLSSLSSKYPITNPLNASCLSICPCFVLTEKWKLQNILLLSLCFLKHKEKEMSWKVFVNSKEDL